jgi:hypothetical protein
MASFVLVTMEGGVMLSRSYNSVEPFDRAVQQLRHHFQLLLTSASVSKPRSAAKPRSKRN